MKGAHIPARHYVPVLAVAGSFVAVVVLGPWLVGLATTWWWMREIGFQSVFVVGLTTRLALGAGVALVAYAVLRANLRLAQVRHRPPLTSGDVAVLTGLRARVTERRLARGAAAVALVLGAIASGGWLAVLRHLHAVPFGVLDPEFGRDVGYYAFTLPVVEGGLALLSTLVVLAIAFVVASAVANGDLALTSGDARPGGAMRSDVPTLALRLAPSVTDHVASLVAVCLVVAALRTWFVARPDLLFSATGPLVGASYTDVHARLPGMMVAAVAALGAAGAIVLGVRRGRARAYTLAAFAGYLVVSLLARVAYPAAVQKLVVGPTELTREAPFLARHIAATRRAWGLDRVTTADLRGEATLTLDDIRENAATIENVRLWDRVPLLQTFGQLQEIRTYYDFVSVDDDRYWIDGRYRQVHLSPRELNSSSLPTRSFINERLTFTHGMGLTLAPVNEVVGEGLPVLFVKDLPPQTTGSLRVTRPQIYYGELTDGYVIVGTRQREFDHPSGEENVFTAYRGSGGVPISSFGRRLLFAWRFGEMKILLSGDITADSRILYHRAVLDRARRALPFLRFDGDPYLVLTEAGELVWLVDAYTSTSRYPYAQRVGDGTNYMRNSVKVLIDAYHGSVRAFVADSADPVVRTYARAFPGVLRPLGAMPADVRAHVRYPEDLFRAQVALHTIYHMTEPEAFYHREDQWQVPTLGTGEEADEGHFMRRIVMRLPGEDRAEFLFMSPFTPRGKDNLASWMVARNDGAHYGSLIVYRFPKQSLVFGPRQIVNRMNQDTEIARQISLWDQRGSEVIRGALMVIPIEESLIYVQPLYLRAAGGRIPELKRVIVAYQNRVAMEETLDAGLARLFGSAPSGPAPAAAGSPGAPDEPAAAAQGAPAATPTGMTAELLGRARAHYDRAMSAQRAGDWATYGVEIRRLGELLRPLAPAAQPGVARP